MPPPEGSRGLPHAVNPLTEQFLTELWEGDPSFREVAKRLDEACSSISPAESAVIGRDLILRRGALYTKIFHLAAFLATDGLTGNDGFMDFTDCVAILQEHRYCSIIGNPDTLMDEPVAAHFNELYLISEVTSVFNRTIGGNGFLEYLILGDSQVRWEEIHSWTIQDAETWLPGLSAKYGALLVSADAARHRS